MFKLSLIYIPCFVCVCFLMLGCASTVNSSYQRGQAVAIDESIIVVKRLSRFTGSAVAFKVFVDGREMGKLANGGQIEFTVPNGTHSIQVRSRNMKDSEILTFSANSQEITFHTEIEVGFWVGKKKITKIDEMTLVHTTPSNNPTVMTSNNTLPGNSNLNNAIIQASNGILKKLPTGQKVSIFNISSSDIEQSEYVIEELTVLLVNSGNLVVLERKNLDVVNAEQQFQMSGDVNDRDIISIGNKFGAQAVITCSINGTGNLRRLRIKVLDVKTGQILSYNSYSI
jgi:hypothetical protein